MSETTRIGTAVAGYRVESVLGRGGMSVVYLAEHVRLGRKVALKVLAPALGQDESFRERFVRESQLAAELDHPNVIPIYDAGEVAEGDAGSLLYIAMRYVEGFDLKEVLKREGALDVGRTLFLLEQAASALDAAHARDLIHRDVKPANILIDHPSDHVFLTDFGVVKHTSSPGLTRTGVFIGTVDYAAPEQIEGLPLDGRVDVYALGCVLYECLTGRPPYEGAAEVAVMHAHLMAPPPKPTDARPDLPPAFDHVVARAMAKSREDRFSTCPELIEASQLAVLGRQPTRAGLKAPAPQPAGRVAAPEALPPRRKPALLAAALAAAVAAAVTAFVLMRDGSDTRTAAGDTTALATLVPPRLWSECEVDEEVRAGALEAATCRPQAGSARLAPERWELASFPTSTALYDAYEDERLRAGVSPFSGKCDDTLWEGESEWGHGPSSDGNFVCFVEDGQAFIVWTHHRKGRPVHAKLLVKAEKAEAEYHALLEWWKVYRDRIGHPGGASR